MGETGLRSSLREMSSAGRVDSSIFSADPGLSRRPFYHYST